MYADLIYWITYTIIIAAILVFGYSLIFSFLTRIPFIPSKQKTIIRMIEVAEIKPTDSVVDLGCGDMKILIQLEKTTNQTGTGYEISPVPYIIGRFKLLFKKSKNQILFKNVFSINLKNIDVVFIYLTPPILKKLEQKILKECKKGTKIISNTFSLPSLKATKIIEKTANSQKIFYYQL
jgi:16S rRNA A1518/A1519 N6-dimethyltransferase RsmA/KsgA/DIM1 with predicted DNA glycosylase/AP lyase activity